MATISPTSSQAALGVVEITWDALGSNDDGASVQVASHADKTVQVTGTFSTATVALQGSNDNTNWATLNDLDGTGISVTVASLVGVRENPLYIRPLLSGGGSPTIKVVLIAKRTL